MNPADANEQTIFDAARQIPDAQARATYLDAVCGGNSSLRERVERLIQAGQRADEFLAADPLELGSASPPTILVPPLSESPGTVIGNYKLLEKLGEGGFGAVYMAEQKQPINRRVALKIIKVGMDTREVVARFEAERQALALMDHANIAKVHDAGATETGRPYFVMELVRGIRITDYCDEKHLSTQQRLYLFTQVCQAVQHAHQKGIIHRDLKPSNILVTVNDGVAVPKIIDFGIAKATQMELTEKTVFTRFHQFLGTPAYMSPEQTELTSIDIDTRSDIYSLGVLLYELLTGQTPLDAKELLKAGLDEMRRTIREIEPDRPSTRVSTLRGDELTTTAKRRRLDVPKLVNVLRGDLDWIVMKCLEKDRARRYETANGLAKDIQRHLSNEPVVACPPSAAYRFQKLVRRNRVAVAAGAGIAAALVIGLAIALWQSIEKSRAYNLAVAAEKTAKTEAERSEQVAQFLAEMLKGIEPSRAKGRDTAMLQEILDQTAKRTGRELTNQPAVEAYLLINIGRAYDDLGEYEKAESILRRAISIYEKLEPGGQDVGIALNELGIILDHLGRLPEAENVLRRSLTTTRDESDRARTFLNLAKILSAEGKQSDSESTYRQAIATLTKHFGNDHGQVTEGRVMLAHVLVDEGKLVEAETIYREALARFKRLVGNEHPMVAVTLVGLGRALKQEYKLQESDSLKRKHRLEEAEALMRQALAIERKLYGNEHPQTVSVLDNLGNVLMVRGDLTEAETVCREVLAMRRKLLGNEHALTGAALRNLASVRKRQNEIADAEMMYREALSIQIHSLGRKHPRTAATLGDLGEVLAKCGQIQEAEVVAREAVETIRKSFGDQHPDVVTSLDSLARVLWTAGRHQEAQSLEQEALAIRQKLLDPERR